MPLHVSSTCAHHQEVKIALHSLWYHHTYRCDDTRGCVMQFWPPHDEHMCSKHVEAWNKLIVKQTFCATIWLITEVNISYKLGVILTGLHHLHLVLYTFTLHTYNSFTLIKKRNFPVKCRLRKNSFSTAHRPVTYRKYYNRCCINTIRPPDDEHRVARNL